MLRNMKTMLASYLATTASSSVTARGVAKRIDGSDYTDFVPRQLFTIANAIGNITIKSLNTSIVFCSETQNISEEMHTVVGQITDLSFISAAVGDASPEYIYNLTVLVANNKATPITIKSIGLYSKDVLLDCFNVDPIVLNQGDKLTVDYQM